jgi:putative methylase
VEFLRLRDLEITLESLQKLEEYSMPLEQYPTPAPIAASVLYAAEMEHKDITNRTVCDLGCGNGVLAIGAALLGARRVIGIDVQSKALKASQMNSRMLGIDDIVDWVLGDVPSLQLCCPIDTVVSNPPFGVKNRGADLRFLKTAISIADVIYSMHLSSEKNRAFLSKEIESLGATVTQLETFQFPIGRLFEHHKKTKHLVDVDLYRICVRA